MGDKKIKLFYYSDLHLEFRENRMSVHNKLSKIKSDIDSILILAGDVSYLNDIKSDRVLKQLCEKFSSVYMICGNHEFYGHNGDAAVLETSFETDYGFLKLVNNSTIKINDYNIIFSSLFGQVHPMNEFWVRRGMNDFNQINYGNSSLTVEQFNRINDKCVGYIKMFLENSKTENNIIVTHHLPSISLIQDRFKGNILNDAFCVDLFDFIYDNSHKIKYWIYGHNHFNVETTINNTQMLTNQFGYSNEGIKNFDFNKFIEI